MRANAYSAPYKDTELMVTSSIQQAYLQMPKIDQEIIGELVEQIVIGVKIRNPPVLFSKGMALELLLALYSFRVYRRSAVVEAFARKVAKNEDKPPKGSVPLILLVSEAFRDMAEVAEVKHE